MDWPNPVVPLKVGSGASSRSNHVKSKDTTRNVCAPRRSSLRRTISREWNHAPTVTMRQVVHADFSTIAPPSSRGKGGLFDGGDDESLADTVFSEESQSVASLQTPPVQNAPSSPFWILRSRVVGLNASPRTKEDAIKRSKDEQTEYLHQTRLRILLKNPEMFRDFKERARATKTISATGVRMALCQFLGEMKLVELLDDLRFESEEEPPAKQHRRRSFFSPFAGYGRPQPTPSSTIPQALPRKSRRSSRRSRRMSELDDTSVLSTDESSVSFSVLSQDRAEEDDSDTDDCSSVGSVSNASTWSARSPVSLHSSFRLQSPRPSSLRSTGSRPSSLQFVIQEDEDVT